LEAIVDLCQLVRPTLLKQFKILELLKVFG
jgi:hypothetical protein